MQLKWLYGLFVGGLLAIILVLLYAVFRDKPLFFIGSQIILLALIYAAMTIYRQIFIPIDLMKEGSYALKDEDFNVTLAETGSKDMNDLIIVYNKMINKIREERVFQQEQHYFLNVMIEALPVGIIILDFDQKVSDFNQKAKDLARKFIVLEELSDEILLTEKKAYGQVIRMMAHEINNSMGAINSILNSLLSGTEIDDQESKKYLSIILDRNHSINQFMKNFADVVRLPKPIRVEQDVIKLLKDVNSLMQLKAEEVGVKLQLIVPEKIILHRLDKEQFEQALINIIVNAIEARATKISIKLEDPQSLTIEDNGTGLSHEAKEQVFTPFFSTKTNGQGIGLTLIREILHNHNCQFSLTSNNGLTQFRIQF